MWNLFRNPMLASVGLEGTDTVQGLKTIDRLRAAQLLDHDAASSRTPKTKPASRRSYRRYKGPFIEFLGVDEFQRDPKAWSEFFGTTPTAAATAARTFDVPGSLDALFERFDENIVCFLANYLRVGAAILLLCTYLRPKAVFGIALMAYNLYTGYRALATPSAPQSQSRHARITRTTPPAPANPAIAILTWFVMVYSKCVPIVALALLLSAISISLHASLRRTVSETRCRTGAKDNVSFSFRQVWKGQPRESRRLLREGWSATTHNASGWTQSARRWIYYCGLRAADWIRDASSRIGWNKRTRRRRPACAR